MDLEERIRELISEGIWSSFTRVEGKRYRIPGWSNPKKLVYLQIGLHNGPGPGNTISSSVLSRESGLSLKTVKVLVNELVSEGYVKVLSRSRAGKIYSLVPSASRGVPATPQSSKTGVPGTPQEPKGVPGTPQLVQTGVPGTPQDPTGVPGTPGVPATPQEPRGVPGTPQLVLSEGEMTERCSPYTSGENTGVPGTPLDEEKPKDISFNNSLYKYYVTAVRTNPKVASEFKERWNQVVAKVTSFDPVTGYPQGLDEDELAVVLANGEISKGGPF